MRPYLAELARIATCYVSCYPNAGLPNAFGQYDELPDETGQLLREFADSGFVNIIGGCCGTTPDHIRAVARAVAGAAAAAAPGRTRHAVPRPVALLGPRNARPRPRQQLPDDRRAHQRHRLEALRAAGRRRRLGRRRRGRARPGARRRQHPRRQHGRGHARLRACDDRVPALHRDRAGDRAHPRDDRQLEVVGASRPGSSASRASRSSTRSA